VTLIEPRWLQCFRVNWPVQARRRKTLITVCATLMPNSLTDATHDRFAALKPHCYGPRSSLTPNAGRASDIEVPSVDDDAVLVRVHAAAVGKGDWLTVRGLPYIARMRYGLLQPKHRVPGFDVAGRIEMVGSNVRHLRSGEEVFGWCNGSLAEYALVPEDQLAAKPANLALEQAAEASIDVVYDVLGERGVVM
jgi:Alcohol dehydrogenase GroES-like domain